MKLPYPPLLHARLLSIQLGLWLGGSTAWAATLSITPPAISNQYAGMIMLAITGLTNNETITLDKFLDANTNGVIDGGDLLEQRFQLTDGQVSLIGGKTNVNVPGDSNPAVSNITTLLNFASLDIDHIVGTYLFKLSSPTARFAAVTNTFNVTNSAYLQSFTGQVRSNGTATAVANAIVVVFRANTEGDFIGGTVANNLGNYTFKAPPGAYLLAAFKSNFVGDLTASAVNLGAGVTVTTNVNAIPATRTVSGRVADAGNTNTPLPGSFVVVESTNGLVAITFTDTNGNFNAPVTASSWQVNPQERDSALHGYVDFQNSIRVQVNTTTGSVSSVNILLPKGTAMIYGSIKDDLGNPLPGASFYGQDQDTYQYESSGVSDANGNYAVVTLAGNWNANFDSDDLRLTNYVYSRNFGTTLLTNGQAVRQDFLLKRATNHITGYVRDNLSNPIAGVGVYAYATINGTNFNAGNALTDGNGNYTLNVVNGTWGVGVNCSCSDCSDSLGAKGYQCVNNQQVTISGNNGVANFTAFPLQSLQITTTSLPDGTVGVYCQQSLSASGGQPPYFWWLPDGTMSLPPGTAGDMDFSSDGVNGTISGTPGTAGTFSFWVGVSDNASPPNVVTQLFSITISGGSSPLQVTTASLPNGTLNVAYNQTVHASGGQQPYGWSLAPGFASLPPGLNLSSGGTISGTPTNSGTFYFYVRATDALSATADGLLSIYIPTLPLQITTLTLPNAQQGASYTNQLQASGGQLPYSWSLAPGSLSLPPNLNLSSGGVISGTPATNGTFFFMVRVTDGNVTFTNRSLGLTINPNPTLTALNRTGNQFQLRLTGATGQLYTVQFSTNLANSNWLTLLATNPSAPSVTLLDPNATNVTRFYRARVGP